MVSVSPGSLLPRHWAMALHSLHQSASRNSTPLYIDWYAAAYQWSWVTLILAWIWLLKILMLFTALWGHRNEFVTVFIAALTSCGELPQVPAQRLFTPDNLRLGNSMLRAAVFPPLACASLFYYPYFASLPFSVQIHSIFYAVIINLLYIASEENNSFIQLNILASQDQVI